MPLSTALVEGRGIARRQGELYPSLPPRPESILLQSGAFEEAGGHDRKGGGQGGGTEICGLGPGVESWPGPQWLLSHFKWQLNSIKKYYYWQYVDTKNSI